MRLVGVDSVVGGGGGGIERRAAGGGGRERSDPQDDEAGWEGRETKRGGYVERTGARRLGPQASKSATKRPAKTPLPVQWREAAALAIEVKLSALGDE